MDGNAEGRGPEERVDQAATTAAVNPVAETTPEEQKQTIQDMAAAAGVTLTSEQAQAFVNDPMSFIQPFAMGDRVPLMTGTDGTFVTNASDGMLANSLAYTPSLYSGQGYTAQNALSTGYAPTTYQPGMATAVGYDPSTYQATGYSATTTGPASTALTPQQQNAMGYDAAITYDRISTQAQMDAAQGTVDPRAVVNAPVIDIQGAATGINSDGSINYAGQAFNQTAIQQFANIIDTSTVAGRLLAQELGEGNYTDAKATMQGQMQLLSQQFVDPATGEPRIPTWAAGIAREVSRIAAFKGMTGTAATAAMAQAIMEASLPIAAADSQFFQGLTLQNLDNRQKTAINKAQILSNISLANMDARMTAAVTNSRNFMEMSLANLNNRQQAAVINTQIRAQSILEDAKAINAARMFSADAANDFTKFYDNLSSQISMFNSSQINSMAQFNTAAMNEAAQFSALQQNIAGQFNANAANEASRFFAAETNATSRFNTEAFNQAAQFNAAAVNAASQFGAAAFNQASMFNTAQNNQAAMFGADARNTSNQFNASAFNAASQFNAQLENQREQFYREMQFNVDLANARWRQTIETTNTQMNFAAAQMDVQNMFNISRESLNRIWDRADALLDYTWKSSENEADRQNRITLQQMQIDAERAKAKKASTANIFKAVGSFAAKAIFGIPSDARLKDNLEHIGTLSSGTKIYSWAWNENAVRAGLDKTPAFGVIAQEIMLTNPEAVIVGDHGYYMVDYSKVK